MRQQGRGEDDRDSVATPKTLRVVLADDHPLYREALVRAVEWHPQLDLVGEAGDGPAALALIEQLEPDVAILDLHMPRMSGLQICSHLDQLEDPPATEVLLVSAFASTELIAEANRCGAAGYVSKDAGREELTDAIVTVGTGGRAFGDWQTSGWPGFGRGGTTAP